MSNWMQAFSQEEQGGLAPSVKIKVYSIQKYKQSKKETKPHLGFGQLLLKITGWVWA